MTFPIRSVPPRAPVFRRLQRFPSGNRTTVLQFCHDNRGASDGRKSGFSRVQKAAVRADRRSACQDGEKASSFGRRRAHERPGRACPGPVWSCGVDRRGFSAGADLGHDSRGCPVAAIPQICGTFFLRSLQPGCVHLYRNRCAGPVHADVTCRLPDRAARRCARGLAQAGPGERG
jgi:hypothetical protein